MAAGEKYRLRGHISNKLSLGASVAKLALGKHLARAVADPQCLRLQPLTTGESNRGGLRQFIPPLPELLEQLRLGQGP